MKVLRPLLNQRGFSLLFIVLLFTVAGLLAFAGLSLKFSRAGSNIATTHRMRVIHAAAQNYYRGHGTLPPGTAVPVSALGLDSRYKYDSFGQEFYFNWANDFDCTPPAIDINRYTVDGTVASGVILSNGPDQAQDTTVTATTTTNIFTKDDDISLGINLFEQAQEKVREKLQILADKVWVAKYCKGNSALKLNDTIATYGLSNDIRFDPWCDEFSQDSQGNFSSSAGGGTPITVAEKKSPCPNAQNDSAGGPGTPPGGTTEAVAYWNFNNPSNVGLSDSDPADGKDAGIESLASTGCDGYALYFNDSPANLNNDFAFDSNPANYSFERSSKFSIVALIKATANDSVVISKMPADLSGNAAGPGYELSIDNNGYLSFSLRHNDSLAITVSSFTVVTGSCHHIAATYSGNDSSTGLYVYVDGNDDSDPSSRSGGPLTATIQNSVSFRISGRDGNDSLFNGYVDNLAIYGQALPASEVSNLYSAYNAGPIPSFCSSPCTGGTITTVGSKTIHTFTANDSFSCPSSRCVEVLVVGGGGAGGGRHGGGGGAGGLVYNPSYSVTSAITVTVGAGGLPTQTASDNQSVGGNGGSSVFGAITALGGGGGGSYTAPVPLGGGSGGGGGGGLNTAAGLANQLDNGGGTGYGFNGGNGGAVTGGGGGGGADAVGSVAAGVDTGGNGGIGKAYSISGSSVYYAGGGGGGGQTGGGTGGSGGGGNGGNDDGTDGAANTGGGGGGVRSETTTVQGKQGGSGVVIISY